ncbi:MAG: phosphate ABC transporter permease subunit PstC, partial [Acidimicrobiales bacterium]
RGRSGLFRGAARVAATLPLLALAGTITILTVKALPSIRVNGLHFLTGSAWRPGSTYGATVRTNGVEHPLGASYGIWPLIVGTLQTSVIAVVLAVPISIGAAFALTERMPAWLSRPLSLAVEILAGIPSVILGLWGVLTLGPFLAQHVYPLVADHVPDVPVLRYFRGPTGHGEGLATSGLVLTMMIVPIITATTRDLFRQVPNLPKEGATALGMTDAETARRVTVPWVRTGIIGATVLGLGRALGETIAVAMISGAALNSISTNIYGTMGTIAAAIVTQLDSAYTDGTGFAISALAEAALVLAVITVGVNLTARLVISRSGRLTAPVGRSG